MGRGAGRQAAFHLARDTFIAGRRVELGGLATTIGVNRATIHRWFGNRATLLADIVWSLTEPTLANCYARAAGTGGTRVAEALSQLVQLALEHHGMRTFLDNENETALRLLTCGDYPFQPKLINATHDLLRREHLGGHFDPDIPLPDLAYLCVRTGESFVYTDTITGQKPDPQRARQALHFLLR